MPFTDRPKVVFNKNPLAEVICQVRYQPILRIDSELPSMFQELVRLQYPIFSEEEMEVQGLSPSIVQVIRSGPMALRRSWKFSSEDGSVSLSLTRDFLALSTVGYSRWEEFRPRIENALNYLIKAYSPGPFTRIGLRYRNTLVRSELGLTGTPWSELLTPEVAAEFGASGIASEVAEAVHRVLLNLPQGGGQVNLRHGTGRDDADDEEVYLIDCDFFTDQKTEHENATTLLDRFNRFAHNIFRWCIKDRLYDAMEPRPIDEQPVV